MHLNRFGLMAKKHWAEHGPRMYKELEDSGQLEEMLYAAQEQTADMLAKLLSQGMSDDMAWELVKEQWLLLPAEK